MSAAKRNFSRKTFQEDISSQDLSLWVEHNDFGARWLNMGGDFLSLSAWNLAILLQLKDDQLWRSQEITLFMWMLSFPRWTPLRSMICIEDWDLSHDLHSDCCIKIHEHMWAQHRNTWGISVTGESITLVCWCLDVLISMPWLVRPEGRNVISRRAGIFVYLDHFWSNKKCIFNDLEINLAAFLSGKGSQPVES